MSALRTAASCKSLQPPSTLEIDLNLTLNDRYRPILMSLLLAHITEASFIFMPLLAQAEEDAGGRSYNISVALVMLCVILGLLVTLTPTKRSVDFKKPPKG